MLLLSQRPPDRSSQVPPATPPLMPLQLMPLQPVGYWLRSALLRRRTNLKP